MNQERLKIVVVGNYPPDRQTSMRLYAQLLERSLRSRKVECVVVTPKCRFARTASSTVNGAGKWLAYIDKYVLFPVELRRLAADASPGTIFHITDHSNAVYAPHLHGRRVVVTCHDMLAIRGSMGDAEAFCPASRMGQFLQKWILSGLRTAPFLTCVSDYTRRDVLRLTGRRDTENIRTILSATNVSYVPLSSAQQASAFQILGVSPRSPYLLNVASSLPRKNRQAVIAAFAAARQSWPELTLVLVGDPLSSTERAAVDADRVAAAIICLQGVSPDALNALYSGAHAFLFPSYSEGFGWPIIEAQAAGCPVICSNRTAIPEVAGDAAILVPPDNHAALAQAILDLREPTVRETLVAKGFANLGRFNPQRWINDHLALYEEMLKPSERRFEQRSCE